MKHFAARASFGMVAALLATAVTAQKSEVHGTMIPLYGAGHVTPLGAPEIQEKVGATGETMIFNVSNPSLELFRPAPEHANGTAVIIAPGGGFVGLGYDEGGTAVARELAQRGVTALVLKYRTILSPNDATHMPEVHMKEMDAIMARAKSGTPVEVPIFAGEKHALEDGARAVTMVRSHAAEWGVDPKRVGFIGFSAGAFLAVDLAIGEAATRPDFVGVIYGGLRRPIPRDASPAFIAAAADDEYMPDDSVQLYSGWRKAGASAELHIYEHGGHGFLLTQKGMTSDHWFDEFVWWVQSRGLLGSTKKH